MTSQSQNEPIQSFDFLVFDESAPLIRQTPNMPSKKEEKLWKLLIIDDDKDVHNVTRMVLNGFVFEGRKLELISCYSQKETEQVVREHPDVAVILLDVVMEMDNSGLEIVKYIRNTLKNKFVRIIIRTGQPGQAPERQIIVEYDINYYVDKTEITKQRLITLITSALRVYRDMKLLSEKGNELDEKFCTTSLNW